MFGAAPVSDAAAAPQPADARAERHGSARRAAAAGAAQRAAAKLQRDPVATGSGSGLKAGNGELTFGYHYAHGGARAGPSSSIVGLLLPAAAQRRSAPEPFTPEVGQPGKDVVWVPTPEPLVEKMLDLAKVGRDDFVIDLGSGDGRNVIGAARRGARALGVEYNPDMVELSRRKAAEVGVAGRAKFERGDMFQADISRATVMALFLLPSNLLQLRPKFLALAPGSRIVSNTFLIADWPPDAQRVDRRGAARCGARRTSGSCRRRSAAAGACGAASWRSLRRSRSSPAP